MGAGKSTTGTPARRPGSGGPTSTATRRSCAGPGGRCPRSGRPTGRRPSGPRKRGCWPSAAASDGPTVVAVAGGAVLDPRQPAGDRGQGRLACGCGPTGRHPGRPGGRRRAAGRCSRGAGPSPGPPLGRSGRRSMRTLADLARRGPAVTPAGVVERIVAALRPLRRPGRIAVHELSVDLGERSYPVLVGSAARHRLLESAPTRDARRRRGRHPGAIPWAVDAGIEQRTFLLDDGEEAKNLESVGAAVPGLRPVGPDPGRCRGRRRGRGGHRRGRVRGGGVPPGHRGGPRPDNLARPGRRGDRRQDGRQSARRAKTWSGRSGSPPRSSATSRP